MDFLLAIEKTPTTPFIIRVPALPGCIGEAKTWDNIFPTANDIIIDFLYNMDWKMKRPLTDEEYMSFPEAEEISCWVHTSIMLEDIQEILRLRLGHLQDKLDFIKQHHRTSLMDKEALEILLGLKDETIDVNYP